MGDNHYELASGDLDSDGDVDLVQPNRDLNSVSVVLGRGDGTFDSPTEYGAGAAPRDVATGDVDGDTHLDLVVANEHGDSVSLLLGLGDGTFAPDLEFATGDAPTAVAVDNLNGDAFLDLVTTDYFDQTVSVLLGAGDGDFEPRATYETGTGSSAPYRVATGDIDGNGLIDLAVSNDNAYNVVVLPGRDDGTFGPRREFPATGGQGIALGDLNGDMFLDVAATSASTTGHVSVLLNRTGAPAGVIARPGDGQVSLVWPRPPLGSDVSGYIVTPYLNGTALPSISFGSTANTQTITGLSNGQPYRFTVRAQLPLGPGPQSALSNVATPGPIPGPPTILSASARNGGAMVSWIAPTFEGGSPVVGYIVAAYVGLSPVRTQVFSSTATTQLVCCLTNGTTYRFRVRAINQYGAGAFSGITNAVVPAP